MLDSLHFPHLTSNSELPNIYFNSIFQRKKLNRHLANSTLPELIQRNMKQSLSPTIKGNSFKYMQKNPYNKVVRYSCSDKDKLIDDRSKAQVSYSHSISITHGVTGKHISARSGSNGFGRNIDEFGIYSPGDTLGYDPTQETHRDEKKANSNQHLDLKNLRTILRKTSRSKIKSHDFRGVQPSQSDLDSLACDVRINYQVLNSYKGPGPLRMKQV